MQTQQPQITVHELIQEFELQKEKHSKDGAQPDTRTVGGHDCTLSEIFDQILDYSPVHKQEAIVLVDFLLSSLNQRNLRPTLPDQINTKILEIVASDYTLKLVDEG